MNNPQDFKKTDSGVVINTNVADYNRARRRNRVRRDQDGAFGDDGTIAKMQAEIDELKALVKQLTGKG